MAYFLGSGTQYLIVQIPAQSNGYLEGRGTGAATSLTAPNAYVHAYDGNLKPATDPVGSGVNNRYTTSAHASAANSGTPALLNALYAGGLYGANDAAIMCGLAEGGASTATFSASAGAAPPVVNARFGIWEMRMRDLVRNLPNPKVLCMVSQCGETNATNSTTANDWGTQMDILYPAALALITALGVPWVKSLRLMLQLLPDLAGTGFANWSPPATPNVQDLEIAWAATQNGTSPNSVITYKPNVAAFPVGMIAADNVHFTTASLDANAAAEASLILAAP